MPALPSDLYLEIVELCMPLFRTEEDRDGQLLPLLSTWPGFHEIRWGSNARVFTGRLVGQLPGAELKAVLKGLLVGYQEEEQIAALWQRIDDFLALTSSPAADPLAAYHQARVEEWSAPRYQLDNRFVQLTLLLDRGPEAPEGRFAPDVQRGKYDSLATLLADIDDRAVVLLGRPGSGKTTLLRRLQLEHAWAELEEPTGKVSLLLKLNTYRGATLDEAPPEPAGWLTQEWQGLGNDLPSFDALFQSGRLLLLLDGLNEIPHRDDAGYLEQIDRWQLFLQRALRYGNTVIFSCRSLDYSATLGSEAASVRQVQVEPLAPAQIEHFLTAYLAERAPAVYDRLRQDAQQLELYASPFYLQLLVEQVDDTGQVPAGQAALLTGFVRRVLRQEVERRHRLFTPGRWLSRNDVLRLTQSAWATPFDLPDEGPLISKVESLAYGMQDGQEGGERRQVSVPEQTALALLADPRAQEILAAGIQLNVLDKDLARGELAFYHQLIQEYFAARVLMRAPEPQRVHAPWQAGAVTPSLADTLAALAVGDPLPPLPATGWEETTLLAAAMTPDQEQFVADLMPANLPLAARAAAAPEVQVSPRLVVQLQQALLARIGDPQADLRARIAAAEALGELGDPRFEHRAGPDGDYLRPPLVPIPPETYTIGDDDSQYDDEKPAHPVKIAAFDIGVFPVTNAEYRLFMDASGYEDERWWQTEAARAWRRGEGSSEGPKQSARDLKEYLQGFSEADLRNQQASPDQIEYWLWLRNTSPEELERQYEEWYPTSKIYHQPEFWDDSRFNHPSRPVVGITWFEARAYCAWLSAQTGDPYDLPTEAEWEAAARGFERRVYAFGNQFDVAHCNTFETHIRTTTPVGVFPGGQTPEGVADLSGNVWEWTTTIWGDNLQQPDFPYPYQAQDGREDLANATARRVVRGGSWDDARSYARAAFRRLDHPLYRNSATSGFGWWCAGPHLTITDLCSCRRSGSGAGSRAQRGSRQILALWGLGKLIVTYCVLRIRRSMATSNTSKTSLLGPVSDRARCRLMGMRF